MDKADRTSTPRVAVVVIGTASGGTSPMDGVFGYLDSTVPSALTASDGSNGTGDSESAELSALLDEILALQQSSELDWRPMPKNWIGSLAAQRIIDRVMAVMARGFGDTCDILLQNPRISKFVPLIDECLSKLGYSTRYVLLFRNPIEVARYQADRQGVSLREAELTWLRYILESEAYTRSCTRVFVNHASLIRDEGSQISKIKDLLSVPWRNQKLGDQRLIAGLVSADVHNISVEDADIESLALTPWALPTYDALKVFSEAAHDAGAQVSLDKIRSEFDRAISVFYPLSVGAAQNPVAYESQPAAMTLKDLGVQKNGLDLDVLQAPLERSQAYGPREQPAPREADMAMAPHLAVPEEELMQFERSPQDAVRNALGGKQPVEPTPQSNAHGAGVLEAGPDITGRLVNPSYALPLIENPRTSLAVVVCCYSGEIFFKDAVASLSAQTSEDFDIIFHDNGCHPSYSQAIVDAASQVGAIVFRSPANRYGEGLRYDVLPHLRHKYTAILHDDDVYRPKKVERALASLDGSRLDYLFTARTPVDARLQPLGRAYDAINVDPIIAQDFPHRYIAEIFYKGLRLHFSTLVIRTELLRKNLLGDPYLPRIADAAFFSQLLLDQSLKGAVTPQSDTLVRVHGGNDFLYEKFDQRRRGRELTQLAISEVVAFTRLLTSAEDDLLKDILAIFPGVTVGNDDDRLSVLVKAGLAFRPWRFGKKLMGALCLHLAFQIDGLRMMALTRELSGRDANYELSQLYVKLSDDLRELLA